MAASYNKSWKILIGKGITKTRKQVGIGTCVLVKMGKNGTVSMSMLAKITTTLNCSVDDIAQLTSDTETA